MVQAHIRTALSQSLVQAIRALPAEQSARVLKGLPPERLSAIEGASRLGWTTLAEHVELLDRVKRDVGTRAFRDFHGQLTVAYLEHPFMKTLFDSAVRLFGFKPFSVISWIPTGWKTAFKGAGHVEFARGATPVVAHVKLVGMPADVARGGAMFEALAGTIEVFITLTKGTGTVTLTRADPEAGEAHYDVALS